VLQFAGIERQMKSRKTSPFSFPLALLLLLLLGAAQALPAGECRASNGESAAGDTLTEAEIKTMLRDYIDTDKLGVGLVVGIVDEHGARVVSHGQLDNGTDRDVDGDTLFEIGSITKVFTALLLQDMVERGEMKLDDPVQKYLPAAVKLPTYQGKPITLLHLATHTSGLPREVNNLSPRSWRNPGAGYSVEQLYDFLSRLQLQREPGARQEYSNVGVSLLAHVIELKAGKDYETLVAERIFRPLGMDRTRVIVPPELGSGLAVGHAMPGRPMPATDFSVFPGAGGLRSTANDLLKFVSAYLGLTPAPLSSLMQKAEALHPVASGATLRLAWWGDGTVFTHSGKTFGYMTALAFDVQKRRGVVVLSNCANSGIVERIWRPLLSGRSPKPAGTVPGDAAVDDRYVGQYRTGQAANTCTIRREGERLLVRWFRPSGALYPSYEVFPQSDSVFSNSFWNIRLAFAHAGADQEIKLTLIAPQLQLELTRLATNIPASPAPVHLDSGIYDRYVGRYRKAFLFGLVHLGPTCNVRRETDEFGDHLVGYITGRHIEKYLPRLSGDLLGGEIFPVDETTFYSPLLGDGFQLTFARNKQGKAVGMVIRLNGSTIYADRVSRRPGN
jgi:serine-type D-Ala-D-Ala carboxypeptidase/endopeptidase